MSRAVAPSSVRDHTSLSPPLPYPPTPQPPHPITPPYPPRLCGTSADAGAWKLLCVNCFTETALKLASGNAGTVLVPENTSASSSSARLHASVDARVLRSPAAVIPALPHVQQLRDAQIFAARGPVQNATVAEVSESEMNDFHSSLAPLHLHPPQAKSFQYYTSTVQLSSRCNQQR